MKQAHQGYTLIELIIVITIISILVGFAIPAYTQFNASQLLKRAATEMKDDLRLMQNRASTGEKNCPCWDNSPPRNPPIGNCDSQPDEDLIDDNRLTGWYLSVDQAVGNNTSYTMYGNCMYDESGNLGYDFTSGASLRKLPPQVVVESIVITGDSLSGSVLSVAFLAANQGVQFYSGTMSGTLMGSATQVVITLRSQQIGDGYTVTVTSAGNMYETRL